MPDLRSRFDELDRIPRPDLWPEIERRASREPTSDRTVITRWVGRPTYRQKGKTSMLSLTQLAVIGSAAVLFAGVVFVASPSPSAAPPRPGASPPEPAIVWDSGSVRLEADALEIRAGDRVFIGQAPYAVHSDPGDTERRTLEVEWTEDGLEQRLYLYFAADEQDWWVTEIRTRDGFDPADWLTYDELGLSMATPRGETYVGDLRLTGGRSGREDRDVSGDLTIEGLRLTAFEPGTGPAERTDCEPVRASVRGDAEPLDEGQPLAGTGVEDMSPEEAEALLRELGLCFTFRYQYRTSEEDPSVGFSERWCTAPPAGTLEGREHVLYLEDGEIVVFVWDDRVMPVREQPPEGWGCPAG